MDASVHNPILTYIRGLHRGFEFLTDQYCALLMLLINREVITKEELDEAVKEMEARRSVEKEFNPLFQKLKAIEDAVDKYLREEGDHGERR